MGEESLANGCPLPGVHEIGGEDKLDLLVAAGAIDTPSAAAAAAAAASTSAPPGAAAAGYHPIT
jgi:hypothetical protein